VRRRDRVFVDANDLFPFSVMDLVLTLAEELIDFVWSDELLAEWERVTSVTSPASSSPSTALPFHPQTPYLTGLLRRRPAEFIQAVRQLAAGKQLPPVSPCDVASNLEAAGASRLSAALRRRLGCT